MGALKPFSLLEPDFPTMFKSRMLPLWMSTEEAVPPAIKVDVEEKDDRYMVKADIPGVAKDDIRVEVDGNMVSISAEVRREKKEEKEGKLLRSERYFGTMSRAFTLPMDVDFGKADATYADGVLKLTLPKTKEAATHRIAIH
jgi:HSP20 family protein